jgi:hypothetical protein
MQFYLLYRKCNFNFTITYSSNHFFYVRKNKNTYIFINSEFYTRKCLINNYKNCMYALKTTFIWVIFNAYTTNFHRGRFNVVTNKLCI